MTGNLNLAHSLSKYNREGNATFSERPTTIDDVNPRYKSWRGHDPSTLERAWAPLGLQTNKKIPKRTFVHLSSRGGEFQCTCAPAEISWGCNWQHTCAATFKKNPKVAYLGITVKHACLYLVWYIGYLANFTNFGSFSWLTASTETIAINALHHLAIACIDWWRDSSPAPRCIANAAFYRHGRT